MMPISEKEAVLIEKLRNRVKENVTDSFFLSDSNIVRWLRMQNNDTDKAEKAIHKHLQWRKEHKIDDIFSEKFSDVVTKHLPFSIHGNDKEGRPVKILHFGAVNAQELKNGNHFDEFFRYIYWTAENTLKHIEHNQNTLGLKECTVFDIFDLDGMTYSKSYNRQFFSLILRCAKEMEANYPHMGHIHVLINAPAFIDKFFQIMKLCLSQNSKKKIVVFGCDKSQWIKFLLERISEDQLSPRYGGILGGEETSKQ